MITSLIEMLELSNFGHITTSEIWFKSRNTNFQLRLLKQPFKVLKKLKEIQIMY